MSLNVNNSRISLVDSSGNLITTTAGAAAPAAGMGILGTDGTYGRIIVTDAGGRLLAGNNIDANNSSTATLAGSAAFTGTSTDMLGYSQVTVMVYADVASATNGLSIQFSNDNTNWDIAHTYTVAASTTQHVTIPVLSRYFRVVYTNGSGAQSTFRLSTFRRANATVGAVKSASVSAAATDPSMVVALSPNSAIAATYNSAGVTFTDGQTAALQSTVAGFLKVSLGDEIAGEDRTNQRLRTYVPANYTRVNSNATTTVKSGSGFLAGIVVGVNGQSANTCICYDNTAGSGTVILNLDTTAVQVGFVPVGVNFGTGLTAVTATGTAADLTFVWW